MSDVDSLSGEDQSNPTGTVANHNGQVLWKKATRSFLFHFVRNIFYIVFQDWSLINLFERSLGLFISIFCSFYLWFIFLLSIKVLFVFDFVICRTIQFDFLMSLLWFLMYWTQSEKKSDYCVSLQLRDLVILVGWFESRDYFQPIKWLYFDTE